MSTIITKFICSAIMSISGLIIMKRICFSREKLFSLKGCCFLLFLIAETTFMYEKDYSYFYTIVNYILMIISYKYILNISIQKSIIGCGIILVSTVVAEILLSSLLMPFFSAQTLRSTWYINIICNMIISLILFITFCKTGLGTLTYKILTNIESKKYTRLVIFFSLLLIAMSIILYSITINFQINKLFTSNFLMFMIFFLLLIILFEERNSYDKLIKDYDNLFDYVKIFEEWIEKEQFIRHEYKNQLAVIRCLTREKKVKEKIDSIIAENINIDNDVINDLKYIPNGGIKGLLYYKIAIASSKKIDIEIDVSYTVEKLFKKLNKNKIAILSRLLGVYSDNAIEAAVDSKRKLISIEVYTENNNIIFVISNTYNNNSLILRSSEKGVSSKGAGRGNGLYFASKVLLKNNWIDDYKKVNKDFYIQKLIIKC